MFVDEARIAVRGGRGGNGLVAFRREKYVPRGGPSGGDGGRGGSVWLVADPQLTTLAEFRHRRRFAAEDGEHGGPDNCHGSNGGDVVVLVPVGTLVSADGELLADLGAPGERVCAARGGQGGLGNQHFATSTNRAPKFAQRGEPGEQRALDLQLKLLADAGIVGAPNAGKSTLLAAVSAARPKIADYPFTTLEPQLGVVRLDVDASFVLADLPGLIEGASRGSGLGDRFLRHVERARVLVHLIDGALPTRDAVAQLAMIESELALWNRKLLSKPRIVAVSKQDLTGAAEVLTAVEQAVGGPVFGISAVTSKRVGELIAAVYRTISEKRAIEPAAAPAPEHEVVLHPQPLQGGASVSILREGKAYRVIGERLERLAVMTDFESDEARAFFDRAFARSGARRKLERLGIRPGDTVRVGPVEFTYS